jgi:pentatricopeptide repeat protein
MLDRNRFREKTAVSVRVITLLLVKSSSTPRNLNFLIASLLHLPFITVFNTGIRFLYEEGLYLRVENLIKQHIEVEDDLPLVFLELLANTYCKMGEPEKAIALCKRIIASGKHLIVMSNLLTEIEVNREDCKQSEEG